MQPRNVTNAQLRETPLIPRDDEGPVFKEPWQARAFAMTVKLAEAREFTWGEWCEALSGEIKLAQANGDPDLGDTYYCHWLSALEKLVIKKGVSNENALELAFNDWRFADSARVHGEAAVYVKGASRMPHSDQH